MRDCSIRGIVVFLSLLWMGEANGRGAAREVEESPEFLLQVWQVEDGLPHNIVRRIMQDRNGYLWLGTAGGLARFDGARFREVPLSFVPPHRIPSVRTVIEEPDGTLLLLVGATNLVRFRDGQFTPHPAMDELGDRHFTTILAERDGVLWAAYANGEVRRWENDRIESFARADGLNGGRFISFARSGTGEIWIASGTFLGRYEAGRLVPVERRVGERLRIVSARAGGLWISSARRLQRFQSGAFTTLAEGPSWRDLGRVEVMFEDRDGALWIGTRKHGLLRYGEGRLLRVPTSHTQVIAISQDAEGSVWAGTRGGGLNRLRRKAFQVYDAKSGLAEDVSFAICQDAEGAMWFANYGGGLARLRSGKVEDVTPRLRLPEGARAMSVCADAETNIWAGTFDGIYRFPPDQPELARRVQELGARALLVSRGGDVWAARDPDWLGRFRQGEWRQFTGADGFSGGRVRALGEDAAGRIWIGTADGELFQYSTNGFARYTIADGLPGSPVRTICSTSNGLLLIGTAGGGLLVREGNRFHRLTEEEGLPDDVIAQLIEDDHGRIWFGARRGFFHCRAKDLRDRVAGRSSRLDFITLGKSDGLSGFSCVEEYQPEACKSRDGTLWFTTRKGVLAIDPEATPMDVQPPPVLIENVLLDGRSAPVTAGKVVVPPGRHRVEIRFAVLSFAAQENVRARCRLEGFDDDWMDVEFQRSASYPRLSPGEYRFQVTGCNSYGVWNEPGATLALVVLPAWWQTATFHIAALLGFAGLVGAGVRFWLHRRYRRRLEQMEREQAVERERTRIAQDIHDGLGASLTKMGMLLEGLERQVANGPTPGNGSLQSLSETTREMVRTLDATVWAVDPHSDTLNNLADYLFQYTHELFHGTAIRYRVDLPSELPHVPLSADFRHNLFSAVKEALNNILKHASATEVRVALRLEDRTLRISVTDNGKGFSPERVNGVHYGLENMRQRLERIGGSFRLSADEGAGSAVEMEVNLSDQRTTNA